MSPTEDFSGNNMTATMKPLTQNSTSLSTSQDVYNSTRTNWTTEGNTLTSGGRVDSYELSLAALTLYLAVRIIWGVLAIFCNGLTIYVVAKFERLQTCTNYLICNLAVNDMMASVVVPLMIVHDLFPDSNFFIPTCLYEKVLTLLITGGNLATILYLSLDRYIYIAHTLRYHELVTPQRILLVLAISWAFAFLTIPVFVFTANNLVIGMPCTYFLFLDNWVVNFYLIPLLAFYMVSTSGLHLAIARIACKQAQVIAAQPQPYETMDTAINMNTKKIRLTLNTVLGVHLLAIMPQYITAWVISKYRWLLPLQKFTNLMYWANSWVNPLIYAWRLKDFRIAFKKVLTGTGSFNEVPGVAA